MIKTIAAAVVFSAGLAGYAIAQEAAPAAPAASMEHKNLPPHHPLRHMPPHHPLRRHRPPHHPTLQQPAPAAPAETPKQ
jgi:hypothetical protein